MLSADIGIDLGTSSVIVYIKGQGIVLHEPSVLAIDRTDNTVVAAGEAAQKMLGRTPDRILAIKPLKKGVISDFDITEKMLKYFITKAVGGRLINKPRIAVCIPSKVTGVEKRAVLDAARQAGARDVFVIEEPIAAAIGSGIDISRAIGSMIVDIGGGTTDIAIISLGGIVTSVSIKLAGDDFDEAIVRYVRKKYNMQIGERTAEDIKINIGTAYPRPETISMEVRGMDMVLGLPNSVVVTSDDVYEALSEPVSVIVESLHKVLEAAPPELSSDISDRGLVMTGGGSLMYGLDKLFNERTGITVTIAENPDTCVAIGTGKYIEYATSKSPRDIRKFGR